MSTAAYKKEDPHIPAGPDIPDFSKSSYVTVKLETSPCITVDPNMRDYSKDPYFVK